MRYFRVCPHCSKDTNTIQVASEINGGIKPCRKHKVMPIGQDRQQVKVYKKRRKTATQAAIDRERIRNKKHREEVAKNLKVIIPQTLSDEEMIQLYYNNKETNNGKV